MALFALQHQAEFGLNPALTTLLRDICTTSPHLALALAMWVNYTLCE